MIALYYSSRVLLEYFSLYLVVAFSIVLKAVLKHSVVLTEVEHSRRDLYRIMRLA